MAQPTDTGGRTGSPWQRACRGDNLPVRQVPIVTYTIRRAPAPAATVQYARSLPHDARQDESEAGKGWNFLVEAAPPAGLPFARGGRQPAPRDERPTTRGRDEV